MKLELKHLSSYLPYDLKVLVHGDFEMTMTYKRYIQPYDTESISIEGVLEDGYVKPILRPLSDLTKKIEHNGEKFVFSNVYLSNIKIKQIVGEEYSTFNDFLNDVDYNSIQLLFKYHFDVFGLIEKNLAIDINTLNK